MRPRSWLQLTGFVITLGGMFAAAVLFTLDARPGTTIYFSILTYGLMPLVIFCGLALWGVGVWRERRLRRRLGTDYQSSLELATPGQRRAMALAILLGMFALLVLSLYGSSQAYQMAESDRFCGTTCHQVMEPEFVTHPHGPHASVSCTQCHIGAGAEHAVKAKLRGIHQLMATLKNDYPRPVPTPVATMRTPQDICMQCHSDHMPETKLKDHSYTLAGDDNPTFHTRLLLKTAAIHAHPETEYLATDDQRQNIPYVRVTRADGSQETFVHEDADAAEFAKPEGLRSMDCLDCHNRAAHRFARPRAQINALFAAGKLPPLPDLKTEALACFDAEPAEFANILREAYGEDKGAEIAKAAEVLETAWRQSHFPGMNTNWRSHPDNRGHTWSEGCFRCHGGQHHSQSGVTISADCALCHDIVGQGQGSLPPLTEPQIFKHPTDIAEMWQHMRCTECHAAE